MSTDKRIEFFSDGIAHIVLKVPWCNTVVKNARDELIKEIVFTVASCISMTHLPLHTNKCTEVIYCLIIHIKTLYSFVTPTCFDTLCVIIREHTLFPAEITD
jgi:hypothetical protein